MLFAAADWTSDDLHWSDSWRANTDTNCGVHKRIKSVHRKKDRLTTFISPNKRCGATAGSSGRVDARSNQVLSRFTPLQRATATGPTLLKKLLAKALTSTDTFVY
jgi:hypothetical protein